MSTVYHQSSLSHFSMLVLVLETDMWRQSHTNIEWFCFTQDSCSLLLGRQKQAIEILRSHGVPCIRGTERLSSVCLGRSQIPESKFSLVTLGITVFFDSRLAHLQEWATTNNIALPSREKLNAAHVFKHEVQVEEDETPNNILQVSLLKRRDQYCNRNC